MKGGLPSLGKAVNVMELGEKMTQKEANDLKPKVTATLKTIFKGLDKGIGLTNREKAEAFIWSTIDNEELDIIATHLVEMGQASRIVATAVRKITNAHRLLQIGVITLPRFILTYKHYQEHGGFALPFGGGQQIANSTQSERTHIHNGSGITQG